MFQFIESALNRIAFPVDFCIVVARGSPIPFGRDNGFCSYLACDLLNEGLLVIRLIRHHIARLLAQQKLACLGDVMDLAGG